MNLKIPTLLLVIFLILSLSACSTNRTKNLMQVYEDLIYDMHVSPGKHTPAVQIDKLSTAILVAKQKNKVIAPGIYAHLGYMYSLEGKITLAKEAFNEEKLLYPESTTFINGIIARYEANNKNLTNE